LEIVWACLLREPELGLEVVKGREEEDESKERMRRNIPTGRPATKYMYLGREE
jgi:hypothetical protein